MVLLETSLGLGALALSIGYVGPYLLRRFAQRRLRARARRRRVLVLTYDDGPSHLTEQVLQLLHEFDVRATFFMLGSRARALEDLTGRVLSAGHEVGSHSERHLHGWRSFPLRVLRDVADGLSTMRAISPDVCLHRPPHGKPTLWAWAAVARQGCRHAWWTLDSGDTHQPLPAVETLVETLSREGGGVLLLHDLERTPERDAYVLEATRAVLHHAGEQGLTVLTYGELTAPVSPSIS
jgi:peptidoglycan/xylan/chitin deacetylase (PgdA/CDA1 family)